MPHVYFNTKSGGGGFGLLGKIAIAFAIFFLCIIFAYFWGKSANISMEEFDEMRKEKRNAGAEASDSSKTDSQRADRIAAKPVATSGASTERGAEKPSPPTDTERKNIIRDIDEGTSEGAVSRERDRLFMKAEDVIGKLGLEPLDREGGHFRQTFKSEESSNSSTPRSCGTCIYYFLKNTEISSWHKLKNDEIWVYHSGSPAVQLLLFPDGKWEERVLGPDLMKGQSPQSIVPAGTWQASALLDRSSESWGLFSTFVAPGFEFEDFTPGVAEELMRKYPSAASKIRELKLK